MEEAAGIQDWEVLNSPTGGPAAATAFLGIEGDSEGAIKSDYFALDSDNRYGRGAPSDGDREGDSLPDSDNPSWVDPDSDSRFLGEPSRGDPGGFWTSDDSSDGQETPPPSGHESVQSELVPEGVMGPDSGQAQGGSDSVGVGEAVVVEGGSEESVVFGAGDGPRTRLAPDSPEENSDLVNHTVIEGGKSGWVWWKLPVELLKFCAFRIRPVWSISIAAALVGVVILGRRLYKKKPKSKSLPLKVSVDDKKVSQFMVRAARLNEAFSVVKRVPIIRATLPNAGVTPWPVVALR